VLFTLKNKKQRENAKTPGLKKNQHKKGRGLALLRLLLCMGEQKHWLIQATNKRQVFSYSGPNQPAKKRTAPPNMRDSKK